MAEGQKKNATRKKPAVVQVSDVGRLQPQARDLEAAILGALMLEKEAFFKVNETLKPESFYEKAHELIYQAILDLAARQQPIDMLTVVEQLKKKRRSGNGRRTALHLAPNRKHSQYGASGIPCADRRTEIFST